MKHRKQFYNAKLHETRATSIQKSDCLNQAQSPLLPKSFQQTFTNVVYLTKSPFPDGSGLSLNISGHPFIIDRPILISYVSIVTTRYLQSQSRSVYHCVCPHKLPSCCSRVHRNLPSTSFHIRPSSPDRPQSLPCFLARSQVQGEDEVNQTRGQMHATTRIPVVHSEMITLTHPAGRYHQRGTSFRRRDDSTRSGLACLLTRVPVHSHERTRAESAEIGTAVVHVHGYASDAPSI